MMKREPRVYYIAEKEDRKAVLVFDAGYIGGDVHIYELKETRSFAEIEEEVKKYLKIDNNVLKEMADTILISWIEKNIGYPIFWKLSM